MRHIRRLLTNKLMPLIAAVLSVVSTWGKRSFRFLLRVLKAEPPPLWRFLATLCIFAAIGCIGILLQPHWGANALVVAAGLAVFTFVYGVWPGRISPLQFGREILKAFLTLLGLISFTGFLLGFGRLTGWDVVTAIGELIGQALTGGG